MRLPAVSGEWIDRSRSVEFRFEGRTYKGYEGDIVTTALWGADVRVLGRSFKYHRPRGVLSLANHDTNATIRQKRNCRRTHQRRRSDVQEIEQG